MAKHIKKAWGALFILSMSLTMLPVQVWAAETPDSPAWTDGGAASVPEENAEQAELEAPDDEAPPEDEPEGTIPMESEALPEDEPVAYSSFDVVTYAVTGGNLYFDKSTGTITDCDSNVTETVIPSAIEGVSVTSIGDSAFYYCSGLTSVTIPDSVTAIGKSAFYGSGLSGLTIPNSVTAIGESAFAFCNLTSIAISSGVTSIGNSVFYDCSKLTSVTIPSSVISIGYQAFYGCSGLTSVMIPNSVTSIGEYAFRASGLTSVTIPDSVTSFSPNVHSPHLCLGQVSSGYQ